MFQHYLLIEHFSGRCENKDNLTIYGRPSLNLYNHSASANSTDQKILERLTVFCSVLSES